MLNFEILASRWDFFLAVLHLFQFVQALFSAEGPFYFWLNAVSSASPAPTYAKCVGRTTSDYCYGTGMTMVGAHLLELKVGDVAPSCAFCVNGEHLLPQIKKMANLRFGCSRARFDFRQGAKDLLLFTACIPIPGPTWHPIPWVGLSGWGMMPTTKFTSSIEDNALSCITTALSVWHDA
jgi:hypothetical protein